MAYELFIVFLKDSDIGTSVSSKGKVIRKIINNLTDIFTKSNLLINVIQETL